MLQKKKNISCFLLVMTLLASSSFGYAQTSTDDFAEESLQDARLVAWSGLGGAILGLSTLSFVDDPSDHLKNVYVGAAIGVVLGVGLVAYLQANKAQQEYDGQVTGLMPLIDLKPPHKFSSVSQASYGASWTLRF